MIELNYLNSNCKHPPSAPSRADIVLHVSKSDLRYYGSFGYGHGSYRLQRPIPMRSEYQENGNWLEAYIEVQVENYDPAEYGPRPSYYGDAVPVEGWPYSLLIISSNDVVYVRADGQKHSHSHTGLQLFIEE